MMPWFIWKGKNSLADFGLWIGKLPKRIRSQERHEEIDIPGRAGSLIMLEGEDIYSAYQDDMTVIARNTLQMDEIMDWLRGSSELILYSDKEKARPARIVGEVAFRRIGNDLQQAVIPFFFQPFRKQVYPETISMTGVSKDIYNPGDIASKPLISITGSGNVVLEVAHDGNIQGMIFSNIDGTINVDCDAQLITKHTAAYVSSNYYYKGDYCTASNKLYIFTDSGTGSTLVSNGKRKEITDWNGQGFDYIWQGTYTGDYVTFPKGSITLGRTGSATMSIQPNWRWL